MIVRINDADYTLEVKNFFGSAYSYQTRTGEPLQGDDPQLTMKVMHGALILCNEDYNLTLNELIAGISDDSVTDAINYVNSRLAIIFADKTDDGEKTEKEEDEKGED